MRKTKCKLKNVRTGVTVVHPVGVRYIISGCISFIGGHQGEVAIAIDLVVPCVQIEGVRAVQISG